MQIKELIDVFVNNSLSVALVIFYLYKDYKFNNELVKTLQTIQDTLKRIDEKKRG